MSKIITSPIADFPGTITLKTEISLPLLAQYDDAKVEAVTAGKKSEFSRDLERFNSIIAMCERWDIEGQPEGLPTKETFSVKNKAGDNVADRARELLQWLIYEINVNIGMETAVPKFLQPESTSSPKAQAPSPAT